VAPEPEPNPVDCGETLALTLGGEMLLLSCVLAGLVLPLRLPVALVVVVALITVIEDERRGARDEAVRRGRALALGGPGAPKCGRYGCAE
jgi:hypothetical protein